jgi:hypothetical protein
MGILDRVDAPTLTDQGWERKMPFAVLKWRILLNCWEIPLPPPKAAVDFRL